MTTEKIEDLYNNLNIYPEVKALSNQVKKRFIVAFELRSKHIKETEKLIQLLPNHLQEAPLSFLAAMNAISDAACLPQRIAYGQAWQQAESATFIHALHRINKTGFLPGENLEEASARVIKQANTLASKEMKALVNSETRFNQVFKQSIETLLFDCFGQPTEQAARELRYQTVVAIWSSLEVLIKDQLIQIINWKPELAKKLTTDEIAKNALSFQS
jgi:hypothetical protein